jgi:hypothetical protein
MSAFGTKQTSISTLNMSAFGGKADISDRALGDFIGKWLTHL